MPNNAPTILALDFDGVLCDGLLEYFQTAWRTYCQIWTPDRQTPPEDLAPHFYRLRPVVETGWEMPVLLRALILGVSEERILQDWSGVLQELVASEHLDAADLGEKVDTVRDEWITTDLESWLELHRFYPGVIDRIQRMLLAPQASLAETPTQLYIVTTKEGRFVRQLLERQGIKLREERIIGKEFKRPKYQTLRQLIDLFKCAPAQLWFVEDRLKTLQSVQQQSDLQNVRLYLADWGYNTAEQQDIARHDPKIELLSLAEFAREFSNWPQS
jgi:phosphoglycolate phosphatase-like HAD superfamily hydrolase